MRTLGRAGVGGNPPNAKPLSPYAPPASRTENGRQPTYQMYVVLSLGNFPGAHVSRPTGSLTLVYGLNPSGHHRCLRWQLRQHRNRVALVPLGRFLGMHRQRQPQDPRCLLSASVAAKTRRRRIRRRGKPWRQRRRQQQQHQLAMATVTVTWAEGIVRRRDCSKSSGRSRNAGIELTR